MTGLAALLGLVALTQPLWSFHRDSLSGDVDRDAWGWTAVTSEEWRNGVWASTTVVPYSSPTFRDFAMREAIGNAYAVGLLYFLLLAGMAGLLYYAKYAKSGRISTSVLRFANLVVLGFGGLALAYPAMTIGSAASINLDPTVRGFAGSAQVAGELWSWGPATAWWLWGLSVFLTFVVFVVPFLQHRPRTMPTVPNPNYGRAR